MKKEEKLKKEMLLLGRGNSKEIVRYIKNNRLEDETVLALIERGIHNEIMELIENSFGFRLKAQIALVERLVDTEICFYAKKWGFDDEAEEFVYKQGRDYLLDWE